jgi:protein SCO1/2
MKLAVAVGAAALGCAGLAIAARHASSPIQATLPASEASPPAPAPAPGQAAGSFYDLDLRLTGTDGRGLEPERLRGHPVVAGMFFAACPSACPLLIRDLQQTIAGLPARERAAVRVLLISFDPARDTPAVLADVLRRHDLDAERWLLAAPADDDGARLAAAALGIRYRRTADGQFEHTRRVTLLDGAGQVRAQGEDLRAIAAALPAAH